MTDTTVPLSVDEVIVIIETARELAAIGVAGSVRWQAAVADANAVCAADQLAAGNVVLAHEHAKRAAFLHLAYEPLRDRLSDAEFGPSRVDRLLDDETLKRVTDARIAAVAQWAAAGAMQTAAAGGVA